VLQHITAFTALAFRIPKGATPATLTLTLTGFTTTKITARLPSGVTPVACPTTSSFTAGGQQSVAAAPKFSCKDRSSIGQLRTDGKAVVFPGIGRLIRGHTLSFVVLPGTLGLDRMVFTRPGRTTLSLLRFLTTPTSTPTLPATPAPRSSGGAGSTTPPLPGNVNVPVPGEPRVSVPPDPGSSPQIATTTTQPALRTTAASPIDDTRARAAALALLVALVVTTLWLAVTDASGRAYTTMRVMRALSTGAALPELTAKEWGVGRFRGPRDGRPPPI
jgi:hypothetical protein